MVANGLLNFFQATTPKTPAVSTTTNVSAKVDTADSSAAGRKFARMVDDSSARNRDQTTDASGRVQAKSSTSNTSRTARREPQPTDTPTQAQLTREITPEEAADMLRECDGLATELGMANDDSAKEQLRGQLAEIVATDTPKTVGEILAEVQELPADTTAALTDTLPATAETAALPAVTVATLTHTAQRVFHLVSKALSTSSEEAPSQDDIAQIAPNAVNPALLALQAATFQAVAPQTEETAVAATSAIETVTVVTPLAQRTAIQNYATTAAAEVEAVSQSDVAAPQDINSRIPTLKLAKQNDALPDVELPHAQLPTATTAASDAAPLPAKSAEAILGQLQALGTGMKLVKDEAPVEVKSASTGTVSAINALTPGMGGSGVISPNAIAPAAGVLGHGVVNHAPVSSQVSVAIQQASKDGIDQITVQLDPGDMGRIEVKLHMHKDGHTQVAFMVDKPETFDALSRDARALEQSLQEAGIKADTSGMQFNLRQQPQQMQSDAGGNDDKNQHSNASTGSAPAEASASLTQPTKTYRMDIRDGVDIQA